MSSKSCRLTKFMQALTIMGCLALFMISGDGYGNQASATTVRALSITSASQLHQQTSMAVDADTESIEEIDAGEQEQSTATVKQQSQQKQKQQTQQEQKIVDKNQKDDDQDVVIAFNRSESLVKVMKEHKGDFDSDLFNNLLTGKELAHLLLSDIQALSVKISQEFPEVVKLGSIGQTWENREITYLELDARQVMIGRGVKAASTDNPIRVQRAEKKKDDSALVAEEMADGDEHTQEVADKVDDASREEKKERQKKLDQFNAVPDDIKADAAAEALGSELIQLSQEELGIKGHLMKNLRKMNLAQISVGGSDQVFKSSEDEGSKEGEQSISDLTSNAKEQIKNNEQGDQQAQAQQPKKEDAASSPSSTEKKEEKKEEPKKEEKKESSDGSSGDDESSSEEKKDDKKDDNTPKEHSLASQDSTQSQNSTGKENATAQSTTTQGDDDSINNAQKDIKVVSGAGDKKAADSAPSADDSVNALMITGATHSRELLSSQVPLYICLKLLHQGYLQSNEKYQRMLASTKFYFIPIINVDGSALVELHWEQDHQIINKRKNANPQYMGQCGAENSGTDLNRNYGVDWESQNVKNRTELCGDYWPGEQAFSEPESRAIRDFVSKNKHEIKFIINCHTSGNDFVWPYNGREPNDIEKRSPGYLAIFQDISDHAPFPDGVMKGNSYEVIGDKMGGDADDYMMATFGIPSVTAEMGFFGQFIKDWRCQSKSVCYEILRDNTRWIEYIIGNLGQIGAQLTIR